MGSTASPAPPCFLLRFSYKRWCGHCPHKEKEVTCLSSTNSINRHLQCADVILRASQRDQFDMVPSSGKKACIHIDE